MKTYQIDPFSNGPAVSIATGEEIDHDIIKNLLNAGHIGNDLYNIFVHTKLVTPPKEARALAVEIIMDSLLKESCKSSTRRKR